jgi:uncharacterized coiled-coil protein SlyX
VTEPTSEVATVPPAGGGTVVAPEEVEANEFEERVSRLLAMIEADPSVRDRVLVELYVTIAEFKLQIDQMQAEFAALGPKGIFKMMRGG